MGKNKKIWIKIFSIFVVIIIIFLGYAHYEYTNIKIKEITLESKDIPQKFDGKRIMFVADYQIDTIARYNKAQMKRINKIMNKTPKDMILIGGDYVNWTGKIDKFYNDMKDLQIPQYGVYAILGNHDYIDDVIAVEKLKSLGYEVLRNENKQVKIGGSYINIAGVEDLWKGKPNATEALKNVSETDFTILLNHNPEYFEDMTEEDKKKSDIILSGHVHGGQVTFFGKIIHGPIKNLEKYGYGMKNYDGHKLYITSGLGGSAFEMYIRFFAQPEVVVFKLKKI